MKIRQPLDLRNRSLMLCPSLPDFIRKSFKPDKFKKPNTTKKNKNSTLR